MDKLSLMFDAKEFAAEFGAAGDDSSAVRAEPDVMMWLGGGVEMALVAKDATVAAKINGVRVRLKSV